MKYEALARPGKIGKMELKNRVVMAPLNNNYTHSAYMTDESVDFYVARARGGAGLVIIEATSVDYPRSRSVLNPSIDDDRYIPGFQKIAEGCHRYGAKVIVQLSHVGRQTRRSTTGMDPVAPSPIASKSPLYPDTPHVLTAPEIEEIVEMFGQGAVRAKKAGLDGVELIFAHGYLANNFLTPISNQRTDEYGGIKGGVKFCVDIIRRIKDYCGEDYPVVCRINADDYIKEQGNSPVEAQLIAQRLEAAGADGFNVSAGMRDSELSFNDHTSGMERGAWIHLADRIKRSVNVPVIAVKRFNAEIANETIRKGRADFVAFGKQMIADPDYANKVLVGDEADVIPCTSCCQGCYDELWMKKPITCMVNPCMGRPMSYRKAREEAKGDKRILVVGGGPAGCEAALELARKGHRVTLVEKSGALGGLYGSCRHTRAKAEVGDVFAYLSRALDKLCVDVRLNTMFSMELLEKLNPDAVVDATGADYKKPALEGVDLPHVINAEEALDGSKPVGRYAVILACGYQCTWTCHKVSNEIPDDIVGLKTNESYACSAGHAAADVAEELAARGVKVSIVTERDSFVPGMGFTNRGNMFKRFFPKNITVSSGVKVKRIVENGLVCEKEGMEFFLCADSIVMSVGMKQRNEVASMVENTDIPLFRVGDCDKIGNAFKAFQKGYELADRL